MTFKNEYEPGTYNVICQRCGFKFKAYQVQREWTGLLVCRGPNTNDCWESRPRQDFIRPQRTDRILPFIRPQRDAFIVPRREISITGVHSEGGVGNLHYAYALGLSGASGTGGVGTITTSYGGCNKSGFLTSLGAQRPDGMAVYDKYLFACMDDVVKIYDISNLSSFSLTGTISPGAGTNPYCVAITPNGQVAVVGYYNGGAAGTIATWNITNPASPSLLDTVTVDKFNAEGASVVCWDNTVAFCTCSGTVSDCIKKINITDPADISVASTFTYGVGISINSRFMIKDSTYLYITGTHATSGFFSEEYVMRVPPGTMTMSGIITRPDPSQGINVNFGGMGLTQNGYMYIPQHPMSKITMIGTSPWSDLGDATGLSTGGLKGAVAVQEQSNLLLIGTASGVRKFSISTRTSPTDQGLINSGYPTTGVKNRYDTCETIFWTEWQDARLGWKQSL